MIPYADLPYFGIALLLVLPALALGLAGRPIGRWVLVASVLMAVVHYGPAVNTFGDSRLSELWLAAGYGLLQWILAAGFLRFRLSRSRADARWPFRVVVGLALFPLVLAKAALVFTPDAVIGFLGISYITFRALDVLFGMQDGLIVTLHPAPYVAYLFCFPAVSAGPIDRYRRFHADYVRVRSRAEVLQDVDLGVHRIFTGLLYKFILAVLIRRFWLHPAEGQGGVQGVASYMYAYSAYLFFDFAGYSALAVGVSRLLGVRTPENFNRPFLARNIVDFWNRWHISLSTWLRDHVYMRMMVGATKNNWFGNRILASNVALFLTFGLMGAWHGLAPQYLVYGMYHATLLVLHGHLVRIGKRRRIWGTGPWWRAAGVVVTLQAVCFGFLIFSGRLF